MTTRPRTVLVVGATGSIGRLVVAEAIRQGYTTRALVRDRDKARRLPADVQVAVGDVTRPDPLIAAVDGVDAVVFTLGSDGAGRAGAENVDYGRPQHPDRPAFPPGTHRLDDQHRRHQPLQRLQPLDRGARLEAPLRAPGALQRASVHDRATGLVRLQRP
jgi:hypothetical protein